ncbi:MAG TPA: hypothetical protein VGM84_21430 [Steroidobacteraceae bacterium]|jgi:hypothetical protein
MSQSDSNIPQRRIRPRTLATHFLAALFGTGIAISFNSVAEVSPEVMLGKLAPNDFQGLKNYLTFKANDYDGDKARSEEKEGELEKQVDQTTQKLAQLTQQVTRAVAQMTRIQNQMAQTTSQLTRSESQMNQHLAQTDQQLAQLQQRDTGSTAKQTSGTFTTPFTVTNGKRTVLKITSDDKADVLMLGDGEGGAVKLTHSLKDGATIVANNAAGKMTVKIRGVDGGGKIQLSTGDGKDLAVNIENVEDGGTVQVYRKSSDLQAAELSAYGGYGAVTTYKKDGLATAVMGSRDTDGSGFIQLSSSTGHPAVDAEITAKGVGIVRVGPGGNGPAGVVGGSPMPASMIQGNGK